MSGRGPGSPTPGPPVTRAGPAGAKHRRRSRYREANAKEATRDGDQGIGAPHTTDEAGEPHPQGSGRGKGAPGCGIVGGKHGRCLETGNRVHETTTDSGTGEAVAVDGIHFSQSPSGPGMAA